ncbi:MAG: metal-dependent transcriptional regulator, partial [Oscillospiraceae bacterium]|nr:metal-dependent transcriptional regulator [Oscillospiraceae bacterium]
MHLQESGEMYLETILILSKEKRVVRSVDVAEHMGFSKPSVSRAVSLLKQGEYLTMDKDGFLWLTEAGREVAEKIYERHQVLTALLKQVGVSDKVAEEDACRVEHDI